MTPYALNVDKMRHVLKRSREETTMRGIHAWLNAMTKEHRAAHEAPTEEPMWAGYLNCKECMKDLRKNAVITTASGLPKRDGRYGRGKVPVRFRSKMTVTTKP